MKGKPKNLPVGNSDFKDIIEGGSLYVDKTEIIHRLIESGKYYFLSRPRRFGKSLLISTLYHIFKGHKELFKGLYIYDSDFDWEEHPVILMDFNGILSRDKQVLEEEVKNILYDIGESYGIKLREEKYAVNLLKELSKELYNKYGKSIVYLIDEYDKPIINHLGKGEKELRIAEDNREFLKEFYGVLKFSEIVRITRFVFITGVTKFSKVSIFSELNNLIDLTMDERFCDLLGVREDEIDRYLTPHIEYYCKEKNIDCEELREGLRNYYNGYRFSSKDLKVYNPFSLFSALMKMKIENYWFESGTPTYLINLIKEQKMYVPEYEEFEADEYMFSTYELNKLMALPLMFQTGYLTIKDYDDDIKIYKLGFPNKEVKTSFAKHLYKEFSELERDTKFAKVGRSFKQGNIEEAIEIIKSIYSEIPYTLMRKDRINEDYFHTIFYLIVTASGVNVRTEVLNYRGRIDMLIETRGSKKLKVESQKLKVESGKELSNKNGRYYIIEFKCNQSADKAIEQIKGKGYYEPYLNKGKEIVLIGINFSTEKKNIEEYLVEKI